MYTKVVAFSCLVAVCLSAPKPEAYGHGFAYGVGVHGLGLGLGLHHPIAYHVPECKVVEQTFTHKVCTPATEEKCEDIVYKTVLLKHEEVCVDLVTKHCSDGTVATTEVVAEAAEAERKKREADPAYGLHGLGLHGLGYGHGYHVAPIVTVAHQCVETPHKACHLKPVEEVIENSVPHCVLVDATTCEDVETVVPHTVCA